MKNILILTVKESVLKCGAESIGAYNLMGVLESLKDASKITLSDVDAISFLCEETEDSINVGYINFERAIVEVDEVKVINDYINSENLSEVKVILISADTYVMSKALETLKKLIATIFNNVEVIATYNLADDTTAYAEAMADIKSVIDNVKKDSSDEYKIATTTANGIVEISESDIR